MGKLIAPVQLCAVFLALEAGAQITRIDDFQNLAVGKSWKYMIRNSGLGDVGWSSESTVTEISVPAGAAGPDSVTFQISVTVTNLFYRRGNNIPRDTTVDTVYPPYTHLHQCTKTFASNRVSCKDWRGVISNSVYELFGYGYPHPSPLQFGIADYNFSRRDSAEYGGDTLGFFGYDSGQGPASGCFTGQIPSCVRVGFTYLDSIGFVSYGWSNYNFLASGTTSITLIEYDSLPFSYRFIPTGVRPIPRTVRRSEGRPPAYDALGRQWMFQAHPAKRRKPLILGPTP